MYPATLKGRKRKINQTLWKRSIAKSQRAKSEENNSLRNKPVKKRVTGPDCKCKRECFKNTLINSQMKIKKRF